MRYEPHTDEIAVIPSMSDDDLLEYFLYRIFETDEVWSLKDGPNWITREVDGCETQPVWPYKWFAEQAASGEWADLPAVANSIDYFVYTILQRLVQQQISVEIMPRANGRGCLISPRRLFGMLENMMESRDFTVGD